MVRNMESEESEETLIEAFKYIDKDNSGGITRSELKEVLRSFSRTGEDIPDTDIDDLIREADVDGDGDISFSEVRACLPRCLARARATPLSRAVLLSPPPQFAKVLMNDCGS